MGCVKYSDLGVGSGVWDTPTSDRAPIPYKPTETNKPYIP